MCSNLELFDEYTAKLFAQLYQAFPVKRYIDVLEFIERDEVDDFGCIVNAKGEPSKHAEVAWHTLIWLKETGFIAIDGEQPYLSVTDVVLTAKGLEVLKSTPNSVKPSKRIGNELIGCLKTGSLEAAKELVRQAVKLGVAFNAS